MIKILRPYVRKFRKGVSRCFFSPLLLGTLYLFVLIPVFAKVYLGIAGEFYMSTTLVDYEAEQLEMSASKVLRAIIREWLEAGNELRSSRIDNIKVIGLQYNGQVLSFFSPFDVSTDAPLDTPLRHRLRWNLYFPPVKRASESTWKAYEIAAEIHDVPYSIAFQHSAKHKPGMEKKVGPLHGHLRAQDPVGITSDRGVLEGWLLLKPKYYEVLRRYIDVSRGRLIELKQGGLQRFLYFSVVTITTLGFGDLVPVTRRARDIVALQSVLGIIIIGLFINAVAHGQKSSRKDYVVALTLMSLSIASVYYL